MSANFSALLEQYSKLSDAQRIDALEAVCDAGNTSPADRQQASYMLARLLQKSNDVKNAQRALELYQTASDQNALWSRCQLHIAECAAVTGSEKTARAALHALMSSQDTTTQEKAAAQYALAQSFLRAGEKENALQAFKLIREHFPKSEYAIGSLYYLGNINLNQENPQVALNYFRRYLALSPDGHFAGDITAQMQNLPSLVLTPQDHALFAPVLYLQGKYKEALDNWLQSKSDIHFVEKANCYLKLSDTATARRVLQSGIYAHPNSPQILEAAQLYSRLSSRAQAITIWQVILKASAGNADAALWNLAARQSTPQAALPFYKTLVQKYPSSRFAPDSTWWLIWWQAPQSGVINRATAGGAANTVARLHAALKRYPKSKAAPRFAFWIAKFEQLQNHLAAARAGYLQTAQQFPSNYYGFRARAQLAKLNGGQDTGWKTDTASGKCCGNPNWSWPDSPRQIKFEDVAAGCGYTAAVLTMLKQWDEVLQLKQPLDPLTTAWCLANLDQPLEAINAAATGLSGPPRNTARWQFAYPLLYAKLIAANAGQQHLDPCLVHALIREESRYYRAAVSRSNALGLMQLLPSTAAGTAAAAGVSLNHAQDCFDPDKNIRLGTAYLGSLRRRFKGDDLLSVAAYNGGPAAVSSFKPAANTDVYVENIPLDETRDYVRKVFGSYWNYRQIYGSNF